MNPHQLTPPSGGVFSFSDPPASGGPLSFLGRQIGEGVHRPPVHQGDGGGGAGTAVGAGASLPRQLQHRSIGRFIPGRPFRPWFLTFVANEALKARRRRPWSPLPDDDALPAAASGDGPEVSAERLDQRRLMLAAIATLDPSHRAPLVLFYLEGLSESEVAEVLGLRRSTVKSRLYTAQSAGVKNQTLAAGRRAWPRGRWGLALGGLGALVVVAGILLFSVRSGGVAPLGSDFGYYPPGIALSDPRLPDTGVRSSKPAPYFPHGFTVTSDPFPPHIGQTGDHRLRVRLAGQGGLGLCRSRQGTGDYHVRPPAAEERRPDWRRPD